MLSLEIDFNRVTCRWRQAFDMTTDPESGEQVRLGLGSWSDILWLTAISSTLFLTLLPFSSYIVSIPFVRDEWTMSNTESAVVFSAYLVGSALSAVFLLPVTDRVPARKVLLACVVVMVVANVLFPILARDVWTASLLRCAAGAGHVGAYIPGVRLVSLRFAGSMRGTAVGAFVSIGFVGTTGSYAFTGLLLDLTDSWRTAYLLTALVGLIGVAIALWVVRDRRSDEDVSDSPRSWGPDLRILRGGSILLLNMAYALHTAELYLARLWLPLLLVAALVQSGREASEAAIIAATWSGFMFMSGSAGVFLGGILSDRLGRTAGASVIFAVSGAVSFFVGWMLGAPMAVLIVLGFVYGFSTAADSAIYSTAATELAPANRIGSAQGVQNFIGFTVGAIAPVMAGGILDTVEGAAGWGLAFAFNGLLAVAGLACLWMLRRHPDASVMAEGRR